MKAGVIVSSSSCWCRLQKTKLRIMLNHHKLWLVGFASNLAVTMFPTIKVGKVEKNFRIKMNFQMNLLKRLYHVIEYTESLFLILYAALLLHRKHRSVVPI